MLCRPGFDKYRMLIKGRIKSNNLYDIIFSLFIIVHVCIPLTSFNATWVNMEGKSRQKSHL